VRFCSFVLDPLDLELWISRLPSVAPPALLPLIYFAGASGVITVAVLTAWCATWHGVLKHNEAIQEIFLRSNDRTKSK